jgi:hypothetical protein
MLVAGGAGLLHEIMNLFAAERSDPGYFVPVVIQVGDPQELFQVVIIINPVLAFLSPGHEEVVPLFPYPQGMGLDPAQIFDIPDRKLVHRNAQLNYRLCRENAPVL